MHLSWTGYANKRSNKGVRSIRIKLTSEFDLLAKHPSIEYLFLPYNTTHYDINRSISDPIKVCHSPTNRYYKGSEDIIKVCNELEREGVIQFLLIENNARRGN